MSRSKPLRRLRVDPIACTGFGLCAELFPEGVALDDWGYPLMLGAQVAPVHLEHARRAVKACPTLALRLVTDESGTGDA
jgi:ferredoxin